MDRTTVIVLAVLFGATLVRSSLGFGEALVAVPLLALRVPVEVAAPLAVLQSILVAGVVVVQDWRDVQRRSAAWLVGATMLGVPLGLWVLTRVNERAVKGALGAVIVVFAAYSLSRPDRRGQERAAGGKESRGALAGFGLAAGVLGGAYGMNGPPLVVYGALRGWSAREFRATLQAYFLPASVAGLIGYWAAGLLTRPVLRYFVLSLPLTGAAILIGRAMNHRLHASGGRVFLRCVLGALVVIGGVLAGQAASG